MTEINLNSFNYNANKLEEAEQKYSCRNEIKQAFNNAMETTPIHGLPFIVRSKSWYMKLFWILFFTTFAAFGTWLIIKALSDYFEYPVVSEIEEKIERQPEFPAVSKIQQMS